ncbi:M23 family metallopeptidase [Synechococcus sp. KORDI-52]|uniref:M23 family metallopeptidase n=1 Tax=Synechococcus sp. KORDI-52 TaxID=585425 RepID=UPI0005708866|nr:M23 family metallopeptidase [Synechococcus sp. KORDI-52]
MLAPPVEARSFDQSLDALERQRVITPQERRLLQGGGSAVPMGRRRFEEACRSGALSRRDCTSGVARRSPGVPAPARVRMIPSRQPLRVPVSALLARDGGTFQLESVFAVTPRPLPSPGNGDRRLLFPVAGEAVTSSGFGWRLHPILGSWLMHAGRDFAAPEGTPVVAALSGQVLTSGLAGGYGVAVELEHADPVRRTLYGHLSEIYVRQGQHVRQGEVIGRVGSTGLSTGPHLHFELRTPSQDRWQAIDPDDLDPSSVLDIETDPVSVLLGQVLQSLERKQLD